MICMVMVIYSSEPFSNVGSAIFALSPLTSGEFATFLQTSKGGHIIYAFGVIFCKESNGEVVIVCCATYEIQVCSPKPDLCKSLPVNSPTQCIWTFGPSSSFNLVHVQFICHFCFSKSTPTMLSHVWGWFSAFVAPILVSTSPTLLRLRNHRLLSCHLNSCNALLFMSCCHVTYTCIRLRPSHCNVNKCIWSWWRVVITFI